MIAGLERAATRTPARLPDADRDLYPPARDEEIAIEARGTRLPGHLTVPAGAPGIVIFAHGSGSSRHSPRNRFVAAVLHRAGLGTLLFDLLTHEEEIDRANVRAAAEPDARIAAVVSRGGRPDLAGPSLAAVRAPTLLIVGGEDRLVLRLNREAQAALNCESRLAVVPGASHLLEEPGTLMAAAGLACDWFRQHLPVPRALAPATRQHATTPGP